MEHPNWKTARFALAHLLPGSTGFDPDDISGLAPESWKSFDVEGRNPAAAAEALALHCQPVAVGLLIVVTIESYRQNVGPFFVWSDYFGDFVRSYPSTFDDALVGGDIVVLSPATGYVVVVHHNGLIATLKGSALSWDGLMGQ
jgi:hypothetical protein